MSACEKKNQQEYKKFYGGLIKKQIFEKVFIGTSERYLS